MSSSELAQALDDLTTSRRSEHVAKSLSTLERLVAQSCLAERSVDEFIQSQDRVEYNIAGRLSLHLTYTHDNLERAVTASASQPDAQAVIDSNIQILSLLQGMALLHRQSKQLLGRPMFLRILLDILALCRRPLSSVPNGISTTSTPSSTPSSLRSTISQPELILAVLDTLVCLLVDAPETMRAFESVDGVEAVVKVLKRADGSRDVRVKCLEFLYFYLLPEDGSLPRISSDKSDVSINITKPSTPYRTSSSSSKSHFPSTSYDGVPPIPPLPPLGVNANAASPFTTPPSSPTKSAFLPKHGKSLQLSEEPRTPSRSNRQKGDSGSTQSPNKKRLPSPSKQPALLPLQAPLDAQSDAEDSPDGRPTRLAQKQQVAALGVGKPRRPTPSTPSTLDSAGEMSDSSITPDSRSRKTSPGMRILSATSVATSSDGESKIKSKHPQNIGVTQSLPEDALRRKGPFPRLAEATAYSSRSSPSTPQSRSRFADTPHTPSGERGHRRDKSSHTPSGETNPKAVPHTPSRRRPSISINSGSTSPTKSFQMLDSAIGMPNGVDSGTGTVPSSPTRDRDQARIASPSKFQPRSPTKTTGFILPPPPPTGMRSMEEKKALLGTWLGNVDALVEGIQRAGVWGLQR
ncbi:hypothetical protein DL93DRAFT_444754 [Clavulina sp. PMI_390]|nr:hypothetical protein DL93DRAFT_444754 [Clavulina sp. PMI_390]